MVAPNHLQTPVIAIKLGFCTTCYKKVEGPAACGNCISVAYCSVECQKIDWDKCHKKQCKELIRLKSLRVQTSAEGRTWDMRRQEGDDYIGAISDRFDTDENFYRLIEYEPYCYHCYRTAPQLESTTKLKLCKECNLAHFCTKCPQSHEEARCKKLRNIRSIEVIQAKNFKDTGIHYIHMQTCEPRKEYMPLSSLSGWKGFWRREETRDGGIAMRLPINDDRLDAPEMLWEEYQKYYALASKEMSVLLTTLAALEKAYLDLSSRTSLRIHILATSGGQADDMFQSINQYEELLHLLPALQKLEIAMVGTEFNDTCPPRENSQSHPNCVFECVCGFCKERGKSKSFFTWKGPYHSFAKTQHYKTPDLTVRFDSSLSFVCSAHDIEDNWQPILGHLACASHPTLFTANSKLKMDRDVAALKSRGAEFIEGGGENKWKEMTGVLAIGEDEPNAVGYRNHYWFITGLKKT